MDVNEIAHTIKCWTMGMPVLLTGGVPKCRAGDERLACNKLEAAGSLSISSDAFDQGAPIPQKYSQDGQNISPPLRWSGYPSNVASWVLLVEDPDAPTPNPFVHWMAYNIPHDTREFGEAIPTLDRVESPTTFLQGKNSAHKVGFVGCAPPKGDVAHRYFFQIYAIDRMLDVEPGIGRNELLDAMEGHVVAKGAMIGTYQREK